MHAPRSFLSLLIRREKLDRRNISRMFIGIAILRCSTRNRAVKKEHAKERKREREREICNEVRSRYRVAFEHGEDEEDEEERRNMVSVAHIRLRVRGRKMPKMRENAKKKEINK